VSLSKSDSVGSQLSFSRIRSMADPKPVIPITLADVGSGVDVVDEVLGIRPHPFTPQLLSLLPFQMSTMPSARP